MICFQLFHKQIHDWHLFVLRSCSKNMPVRSLPPLNSCLSHTSTQTQKVNFLLLWPACRNRSWALISWNSSSSHIHISFEHRANNQTCTLEKQRAPPVYIHTTSIEYNEDRGLSWFSSNLIKSHSHGNVVHIHTMLQLHYPVMVHNKP